MNEQEWPKLDPITGRMICRWCWVGIHYHELMFRKDQHGKTERYYEKREKLGGKSEHACDGECDCVHRSEENWAAIERQKQRQNRRELKETLQEQLKDPENPLLAVNDSFKPKKTGRGHA